VLLNGIAPVNTCIGMKWQWIEDLQRRAIHDITYLNHDHRERKNIRFFGTWPLVQDLRRNPSRGVNTLVREALGNSS